MAAQPGVTVRVFNAELAPVAERSGGLEATLDPGLYEVQWIAGRSLHKTMVRLTGDALTVQAPTIEATEIARGRAVASTVAMEVAEQMSHGPKKLGKGATLLVVVQDDSPRARANAAAGLRLCTASGTPRLRFEEIGQRGDKHPVWASACVELDPGPYRLRVSGGDVRTIEQALWLVDGWQTQVFLRRRSWGAAERGRQASLPDASILMARSEQGFDPGREDHRLTELARVALVDGRQPLRREDLERLVYGKWENPMLGLFGAHLLRRAGDPGDADLLREAVDNLAGLLGRDHPDVVALDVAAASTHLTMPPMLAASWDLLVRATVQQPALILPDTLAGRIAGRLFGSGVWLVWRPPRRREDRPPPRYRSGGLAERVRSLGAMMASAEGLDHPVGDPIVRAAATLASNLRRSDEYGAGAITDADVVDALRLPRAAVEEAIDAALDALEA